jgi:hypothetical protein
MEDPTKLPVGTRFRCGKEEYVVIQNTTIIQHNPLFKKENVMPILCLDTLKVMWIQTEDYTAITIINE